MIVNIADLLWDSSAFDNNYNDIMSLVESIRENGIINPRINVIPFDRRYLIITGRSLARAITMLGYKQIEVNLLPDGTNPHVARIKHNQWKGGVIEGRNYHAYKIGY